MAETIKQIVPTGEWLNLSDIVGLNARVTNSGNSVLIYVRAIIQPDDNSTDGHRINEDVDFDYEIPTLATESLWMTSMNKAGIASATPDLAIGSLGGALNIHDADAHHSIYNQFLHFDTATVTALSSTASNGDNQINVDDASSFAVGNEIKIENGGLEPLFFNILAIVVNLITLDTPLTFDHIVGSNVTKVFTNMAEAGLTTAASPSNPVIFTSHIPADVIIHVINMSVIMTDTSAMDFTTFGGIAALTNGCALRAKSDGIVGSYTNWKRNFDLDSDAFPVNYQEKVGGGEFGLAAIYHIKDSTGSIIYLDGSKGDKFELMVQDDLTGLTNFKIKLQGHYENA